MATGSKIQAMMSQPAERVWAVYTDGFLVRGYIKAKPDAVTLARSERVRIGETLASRGDKASRVRIFPM